MKKLMLLLIASVMMGAVAVAQEKKDMRKDRTEWEAKVKQELNLTSDQATKFDAISKEYNDKFDALGQNSGLSQEARKQQKTGLKKEKEARLFEFFTPEQQTKYRELMERKKKDVASKPGA